MNALTLKGWIAISVTFLIALVFTILPLPAWVVWFRPEWVPLVFAYWAMALPHRINLSMAWCLGILLDLLSGTLLGQHAFAMVVMAYLVLKFYRQIRVYPLWQQAITVTVFLLIYEILILVVQGLIDQLSLPATLMVLSLITSALLWPWIFHLLRDTRLRFKIY